jgi:putative peptidoglycan lipid II flippase
MLHREGVYRPEPGWTPWLIRIAGACIVMFAAVWLVRWHVGDWELLHGFFRLVWLMVAVVAGAGAYLATHWIFGLRLSHLREV